jgi:uncharacterized protein YllA (UPF0747 family)
LRLRDLPGIPDHYVDFVEYAEPAQKVFVCRPTRENLLIHVREASARSVRGETVNALRVQAGALGAGTRAVENIARLGEPGAVAVLARIPASLFGGPLYLLLKCLTAARLAASLESEGTAAIPVCWVGRTGSAPALTSVRFIDVEGVLHTLELTSEDAGSGARVAIDVLMGRLDALLTPEQLHSDSSSVLRRSYTSENSLELATRRLISEMTAEFGIVIADSGDPALRAAAADPADDYLVMNGIFPAAANVVDAEDVQLMARLVSRFADLRLPPPLLWPHLSATLVDVRSRKTLDKYGIGLEQLLPGKDSVLRMLEQRDGQEDAALRFDRILGEIDRSTAELTRLAGTDDGLVETIGEARTKMGYQIDKIKQRYMSSVGNRREAAARQIERACALLFPDGGAQERRLGWMHFILRYSRAVLREIAEKGDVWRFEHQPINLD